MAPALQPTARRCTCSTFQAGNPQPVRAIVLILDPVLTPFLYFAVPNVWCVSSLATVGSCTERNVLVLADQIELASPPFDSVSGVRFSPTNPSHLLVSSWDTVRRAHRSYVGLGGARVEGGIGDKIANGALIIHLF